MEATELIDWSSAETHVLLNPRLPVEQRREFERLVQESPALAGHVWLATSGSTGVPKMTALGKRAVLASAAAVNRRLGSTARDVWYCVLPTFHVGGLGIYARASLSGARVVREERWDAARFAAAAKDESVTLSALVPAQVVDLIAGGYEPPPSLRAVVVGGGALNPEQWSVAVERGWPLLVSYGMTECCSQIATAEPGSMVLQLLEHVEARREADGRLSFRSEALLTGYASQIDGRARFVDPKIEGWFTTEDRGDVEGRDIVVRGRGGDFVKIGGESVDLARLGAVLDAIAGGAAALVAVPDERLGQVLHLAAERDVEEIAAAFNGRVLPFERIRAVHHVPVLPRTELGKLRRSALQEIVGRDGKNPESLE